MCGISGYVLKDRVRGLYKSPGLLMEPLKKRGPDDEGACLINRKERSFGIYSCEGTAGTISGKYPDIMNSDKIITHDAAFFHSRYSIIDPTDRGHQPFFSGSGEVVVVFNGEIYNYLEIREELLSCGVKLKTSCDTEVLAEGFVLWGEGLWKKMNGFWAFCIYDRRNGDLVFSRDRIGVAPLYYYETEKALYFSSYIKPLLNVAEGAINVDRDIMLGFLQTGIKDHDNSTFYSQIKSLPSSSIIRLGEEEVSLTKSARAKKFWSYPRSRLRETDISLDEAAGEFRRVLFDAVKLRMRADVKLAFELSGGLDSSSVVAAAANICPGKISTYTARIKKADEEPFARSMLGRYALDYHVLDDIEESFREQSGTFSKLMEEPYDNPNDYTHYVMLKRIRSSGAKVIVTGAGGDESFAGYEADFWPKAYEYLKSKSPGSYLAADWHEFKRRFRTLGKAAGTLRHYIVDGLSLIGLRKRKSGQYDRDTTSALEHVRSYRSMDFDEAMKYHFEVGLLPYYMRSSDHFTMGVPIEHRFPFLDYRMAELGSRMPVSYLFRNGWTKFIIRKAMEPYLPSKILWRREKMGFTFPYAWYFRKHRRYFKDLLDSEYASEPLLGAFGDYDGLLREDPLLLWRVLSVAIWNRNRPGRIGRS